MRAYPYTRPHAARVFFRWAALVGIAWLFPAALINCAAAPLGRPVFHRFSQTEAFASVAITAIGQDRHGFIWIGTRDGLYRFDAREMVEYRNESGDPGSLGDNWIEGIFFEEDGTMWVRRGRGLSRYDDQLDRFRNYMPCQESNAIKGMAQTGEGELFALSEGGLLLRYDRRSDTFATVGDRLPGASKCMLLDGSGSFWLGGSYGVMLVDQDARIQRQLPLPVSEARRDNVFVQCLARTDDDRVWAGTNAYGLWEINVEKWEQKAFPLPDSHELSIGSLLVDKDSNLYIAAGAGLYLRPAPPAPLVTFRHSESDVQTIQEGPYNALFLDTQGNLWIGSSRMGLSAVFNAKRFESLRHSFDDPEGLSKEKASAFLEDSNGQIWVGYYNDGIDILRDDRKITYLDPYARPEPEVGRGSIYDLHESSDGSVWIASNWSGLHRRNSSRGDLEQFLPDPANPHSIGGLDARRIVADEKENLWIALHGNGVGRFDRETERFSMLASVKSRWVEDLWLEPDGRLWVASSEGLTCVSTDEDAVLAHYTALGSAELTLSDRHVKCLIKDARGFLWAGTVNGLDRLDPHSGTIRSYTTDDGLPAAAIRSLILDNDERLWVGTSRGLAVYQTHEDRFNAYTRSDGLASGEMIDRSAYKLKDGRLLFGTERGIIRFAPEEIQLNPTPPPVVITGIRAFNVPLQVGLDGKGMLPKTPWTSDSVEFSPGVNSFSFSFAALNYLSPERNRYAYQLEGFDADWVEIGSERSATYTNINPGTYRFRVKASNNDGVWNETGAELAVVALPFYWQTAWFKALAAATALTLLGLGYWLRVRSLARQRELLAVTVEERTRILQDALIELEQQRRCIEDQNLELIDHRENLEELIQQRTEELEAAKGKAEESDRLKSSFLENMTHEIRTPMNAIIGFLNIMKHKEVTEDERSEYTRIVERNGRALLVLIDDILDLSRMEAGELQLLNAEIDLQEMFSDLFGYYQKVAKERSAEVEVVWQQQESGVYGTSVLGDEVRLQQLISNLMDNALKFTERGQVVFGFRIHDEPNGSATLTLFVADTGVGLEPSETSAIFERFRKIENRAQKLYRGIGLGLAIVKRLVDLMHGSIRVESIPGKGTRFEIDIPTSRNP